MTNSTRTEVGDRYGGWALVAGASTGLGAAFAHAAAGHGFDVAILARRAAALDETAAALRDAHGVETRCIVADLADPDIGDVVAAATDDLDVGVLVFNAAAEPQGRFLELSDEEHRDNLAINCWAPTILSRHFGRRMVDRQRGAIALVSSLAGLQGIKYLTTYGAAKAYDMILGEGLWDELRVHGVDALAYMVGATASSTWKGAAAPDVYDGGEVSPLQQRILQPATPEDVAERLFVRLDQGPRQYSNDTDEQAALDAATRPRAEVVQAMGAVTEGLARFAHLREG